MDLAHLWVIGSSPIEYSFAPWTSVTFLLTLVDHMVVWALASPRWFVDLTSYVDRKLLVSSISAVDFRKLLLHGQ